MTRFKRSKVFGIGFHKTGTTSLALAFHIFGYKNSRGLKPLNRVWGSRQTFQYLTKPNYKPILDFLKPYDSCQDHPWPLLYKELDEMYPNSKFILTIRDEQTWLESCKHFFKNDRKRIHKVIYGVDSYPGNEAIYLSKYRRHNDSVRAYFKNRPDDLLIVDWEKGAGWEELCTFLDRPVINLPFPHGNKGTYF